MSDGGLDNHFLLTINVVHSPDMLAVGRVAWWGDCLRSISYSHRHGSLSEHRLHLSGAYIVHEPAISEYSNSPSSTALIQTIDCAAYTDRAAKRWF